MDQKNTFIYQYSAKDNAEIQKIRKKYLPQTESKFEELKRLDNTVQTSGILEALCSGTIGSLLFGVGMCLTMEVMGNGTFSFMLGILLLIIGAIGMFLAYPIYRKIFNMKKNKLAPRILELTSELSKI